MERELPGQGTAYVKTQRFLRPYKLCPRMPNGDTAWRREWGPNMEGPSGPLKEPGLSAAEEESSDSLGRARKAPSGCSGQEQADLGRGHQAREQLSLFLGAMREAEPSPRDGNEQERRCEQMQRER